MAIRHQAPDPDDPDRDRSGHSLFFFLLRALPGDVCELKLGGEGAYYDEEQINICREQLGLNDSLLVQFGDFVGGLATFDLGTSMWTGKPVAEEMSSRFALSLQVAIMATVVSIIIALPLGTLSAVYQNTWIDYVVRTISIAGIAVPSFWLGMLILLAILSVSEMLTGSRWIPPLDYKPLWEGPLVQPLRPDLAGRRHGLPLFRRRHPHDPLVAARGATRGIMSERRGPKGMAEKIIVNRHALKNAMLPVVTVIGIEFAFLMGGLVVTEQVFNLNGLGRLLVDSVTQNDYSMTQGIVMAIVLIFVMTNFVIDLLYAWLDPRIRYS